MKQRLPLLLFSLLLVACAVPALLWESTIDGPPDAFVLTIDDMPDRFRESADTSRIGPTTNEEIAGKRKNEDIVLMKLNEWGRVEGYEALYETSGFDMLVGTAFVHSWASVFETVDGADAYFEALDTPLFETKADRTLNPVSLPSFADGAKGYTFRQSVEVNDGQIVWKFYRITFRTQNVVAGVITAALDGQDDLDETVALAKTMEARIK